MLEKALGLFMLLYEFLRDYKKSFFWKKLNGGSFNQVLVTQDKISINGHVHYWVRKEPIVKAEERFPVNDASRAVRKYYELYPDRIAFKDISNTWFLPFVGQSPHEPVVHAADDDICEAIFEIYQRTGNIIADASIYGNFLNQNDQTLCVDVDLANRRGSISSDIYFNETIATKHFDEFFANLEKLPLKFRRSFTCNLIKALFYFDEQISHFGGIHSQLQKEMMPMLFNYCLEQAPITETILHNLTVLVSDDSHSDFPVERFAPKLFSQLPRTENFAQLMSELDIIVTTAQQHEEALAEEQQVALVLDEMVDKVAKETVFMYSFFQSLPKREVHEPESSSSSSPAILKSTQ